MESAENVIRSMDAGRVLDVATGNGNFIQALINMVRSYTEVTGIDTSVKGKTVFDETFVGKPIHLIQMDAAQMEFPDNFFDTVCISNSLHHMSNLTATLFEMRRVLRPGGCFIVSEMYQDDQTETQMTHVLMHHWWAAVDTARGIHHKETYTRTQILELIGVIKLSSLHVDDVKDTKEDPRQSENVKYLCGVIDQYLERLKGLPGEDDLRQRGMDLRKRVEEIGFHSASSLLIAGQKP